MAQSFVGPVVLRAFRRRPVPRPPQPTSATLIVLLLAGIGPAGNRTGQGGAGQSPLRNSAGSLVAKCHVCRGSLERSWSSPFFVGLEIKPIVGFAAPMSRNSQRYEENSIRSTGIPTLRTAALRVPITDGIAIRVESTRFSGNSLLQSIWPNVRLGAALSAHVGQAARPFAKRTIPARGSATYTFCCHRQTRKRKLPCAGRFSRGFGRTSIWPVYELGDRAMPACRAGETAHQCVGGSSVWSNLKSGRS